MGVELVRDRVGDLTWRTESEKRYLRPVVDHDEHRRLLTAKLCAEVGEFLAATTNVERLDEAADVVEVLLTFLYWDHGDPAGLSEAIVRKHRERGGFADGVVWDRGSALAKS